MTKSHMTSWKAHVFKRTDPGITEQIPEKFGDFVYFVRQKDFPQGGGSYNIYCRHPSSIMDKSRSMSAQQQEQHVETVLDMAEIHWIPEKLLKTTVVDKIKMNSDHSLIAFTVDIGNNERCTAGLKDMKTGKIVPQWRVEDVS